MGGKTNLTIVAESQIQDPLKKFYVYALIDGRDMSASGIFYIGKGTANRGKQHGADALRIDKLDKTEEDRKSGSAKLNKIKEIRDAGSEPIVRVLARYDTEQEAFAAEAILIQTVYGRKEDGGQLTNIVLGHNSRYIRSRGVFDELPRLDIPKTTRLDSGDYSKANLDKLRKNGVNEIAEEVVEQLRLMVDKASGMAGVIRLSDPVIVESGRYVATSVSFGEKHVILRLQFTSKALTTNLRAAEEGTKIGKAEFSKRMHEVGLEIFNHGQYGWIEGWKSNPIKFNDYEGMLFRIEEAFKRFH